MTFNEFQATRRYTPDLEQELNMSIYNDPTCPCPGFIYAGGLYIEASCKNWPHEVQEEGDYLLTIGSGDWLSSDLTALEHTLFEYAQSEDII